MYSAELAAAKAIAKKAGEIMLQYFDGGQQRETKQDGSPVTIADKLVNTMIIEELAKEFPDDIVIGEEESTGGYGSGRRWFCDPIDGTKAFTWGVPTAMFSLGFVVDGKPYVGVCYDPFLDKMYWATKGSGAFCNETPLHVNDELLQDSIIAASSSVRDAQNPAPYLKNLLKLPLPMATYSGAVHKAMGVARGYFASYTFDKVNAHDMAAAHVIVTEAGGKVTDMQGNEYDYTAPFRGTIVSNGIVHDEILEIISSK